MFVRVNSKFIRDKVLEKAKKLKDLNDPYKKVSIKKDSHPEVRKEWKRLKDAEEAEKRIMQALLFVLTIRNEYYLRTM